ncbi:hypothetical protein C7B76_12300 [filamentous cyanobacterium CCP2]|nr:hypothetical protein C7B76_12300 [filamentous cyanobacterium CCP2]
MSQSQSPRLLDQVRQSIRLKHFSFKTEKSYVHYIRDFILFHNKRHPKEMGVDEIKAYLSSCNRSPLFSPFPITYYPSPITKNRSPLRTQTG